MGISVASTSTGDSPLLRSRASSVEKAENLNRRLLVIIFTLHFLINFTWYFLEVPIVRLLEYAVCQQYYKWQTQGVTIYPKEVDEDLCKVEAIQDKVALLVGVKISLEATSSVL